MKYGVALRECPGGMEMIARMRREWLSRHSMWEEDSDDGIDRDPSGGIL